ncbi:hypothetical protein ONS96_013394 [Cadophora gregata f. sp. sojae]|nr:hypothetical protein ONS96_013394 [Cadophora gregata f. sp. sojae]
MAECLICHKLGHRKSICPDKPEPKCYKYDGLREAEPAPLMGPDSMSSYKQKMDNGEIHTIFTNPALFEGQVVHPSGEKIVIETVTSQFFMGWEWKLETTGQSYTSWRVQRPTAQSTKTNEYIYFSGSAIQATYSPDSFDGLMVWDGVQAPLKNMNLKSPGVVEDGKGANGGNAEIDAGGDVGCASDVLVFIQIHVFIFREYFACTRIPVLNQ